MTARPPDPPPVSTAPVTSRPPVSPTRSANISRGRRRWLVANAGNVNSMRHGVFAQVANESDVATEIALIFAAHAALDLIADRRLVEAYAIAAVAYRRAMLAIDQQGMTPVLTGYASRFGAMVERLERATHDRDRQRQSEMRRVAVVDLSRYAPASPPKITARRKG